MGGVGRMQVRVMAAAVELDESKYSAEQLEFLRRKAVEVRLLT